jgi:hypothetical protein
MIWKKFVVSQYRFERNYRLIVQVSETKAVVVKPPFRIAFTADKSVDASLNKLNVKIYGLSPENRTAMMKDAEENKKIGVELLVGYGDKLERIFKGSVHRGQAQREGPDISTSLECQDGGYDFHHSFTSKTIGASADPVDALLADMPNTKKGKITPNRPVTSRPRVLVGNTYKLIGRTVTTQKWYIDDETLNIVNGDEVTSDFIPVVEPMTGLINTPTREEKKVTMQTMFNPALRVAGLCELKSVTAKHLNGIYKIETIGYDGDYSGSNWAQTVTAVEAGNYKVL